MSNNEVAWGTAGDTRVIRAIQHLNRTLPLKKRQTELPKPIADLHRAILRSFAERGRPLSNSEIAAFLGSDTSAPGALAILGANDLVVLSSGNPANVGITGAYPFTMRETPHKVKVFGQQVHAMCALDALSVAPLFQTETWIESRCHVTGEPVGIHQKGMTILEAILADVQFGVRWQKVEGNAAHGLCKEMVYLKDARTAAEWRKTDPEAIEIFNLPDALEFGAAFFVPLLDVA
jgi:mercuric reductase